MTTFRERERFSRGGEYLDFPEDTDNKNLCKYKYMLYSTFDEYEDLFQIEKYILPLKKASNLELLSDESKIINLLMLLYDDSRPQIHLLSECKTIFKPLIIENVESLEEFKEYWSRGSNRLYFEIFENSFDEAVERIEQEIEQNLRKDVFNIVNKKHIIEYINLNKTKIEEKIGQVFDKVGQLFSEMLKNGDEFEHDLKEYLNEVEYSPEDLQKFKTKEIQEFHINEVELINRSIKEISLENYCDFLYAVDTNTQYKTENLILLWIEYVIQPKYIKINRELILYILCRKLKFMVNIFDIETEFRQGLMKKLNVKNIDDFLEIDEKEEGEEDEYNKEIYQKNSGRGRGSYISHLSDDSIYHESIREFQEEYPMQTAEHILFREYLEKRNLPIENEINYYVNGEPRCVEESVYKLICTLIYDESTSRVANRFLDSRFCKIMSKDVDKNMKTWNHQENFTKFLMNLDEFGSYIRSKGNEITSTLDNVWNMIYDYLLCEGANEYVDEFETQINYLNNNFDVYEDYDEDEDEDSTVFIIENKENKFKLTIKYCKHTSFDLEDTSNHAKKLYDRQEKISADVLKDIAIALNNNKDVLSSYKNKDEYEEFIDEYSSE